MTLMMTFLTTSVACDAVTLQPSCARLIAMLNVHTMGVNGQDSHG